MREFFELPLLQWLDSCPKERMVIRGRDWRLIFLVTILKLWTRRCTFIFNPEEATLEAWNLVDSVSKTVEEFKNAFSRDPLTLQVEKHIKWLPGSVKLNTDGAVHGNGAGGLIRDSRGAWIVGFRAHLGVCLGNTR